MTVEQRRLKALITRRKREKQYNNYIVRSMQDRGWVIHVHVSMSSVKEMGGYMYMYMLKMR